MTDALPSLRRYTLRTCPWNMSCEECGRNLRGNLMRGETRDAEMRFVCAEHRVSADLIGKRVLRPSEVAGAPHADPHA